MRLGRTLNKHPSAAIVLGLVTAFTVTSQSASQDVDAFDVYGTWLTKDGEAVFEITDCGDGSPCGAMVWMNPEITTSYTDDENPDPALRGRPLIGAEIIWGFEKGRRAWKNGKLYHAEGGRTYRARIARESDTEISVKGCIGPICVGQRWSASANPPPSITGVNSANNSKVRPLLRAHNIDRGA
ncbi:MAG: DUF2147 domain-containing protein [Pseudomonadota bacterium]